MYANKISDTEITNNQISSLPTRPTAATAFGGKGYSAAEMKAAFDKLPLLIIDKYNKLIDDIKRTDSDAITAAIPTNIYTGHSLQAMLYDIPNGEFAGYLKVGDESLANTIANINSEIEYLKSTIDWLISIVYSKEKT